MWAGSSILQPSVGRNYCNIGIYAMTGCSKGLNEKCRYEDTAKRTIAVMLSEGF
jgi:hypothetical protein